MGATAPDTDSEDPQTRLDWIHQWMAEHDIDLPPDPSSSSALSSSFYELHLGPRPVSAKSIYRLADKLGLLPLKLRAFQHICSSQRAMFRQKYSADSALHSKTSGRLRWRVS